MNETMTLDLIFAIPLALLAIMLVLKALDPHNKRTDDE